MNIDINKLEKEIYKFIKESDFILEKYKSTWRKSLSRL